MAMPRRAGGTWSTTWPPITTWPELCCSSPAMILSSVDLPQPEAPRRTTNSPSAMSRSTPLSTSVLPNDFLTWSILSWAMGGFLGWRAGGGAYFTAPEVMPRMSWRLKAT
jgi:hypothetical protein